MRIQQRVAHIEEDRARRSATTFVRHWAPRRCAW
jgi:hypothetical protein